MVSVCSVFLQQYRTGYYLLSSQLRSGNLLVAELLYLSTQNCKNWHFTKQSLIRIDWENFTKFLQAKLAVRSLIKLTRAKLWDLANNPTNKVLIVSSYSSRVHLIIYILPSALLAVVINIPKWFELKLIMGNGTDVDLTNFERVNITEIDFTATDLRFDSDYVFYYTHLTR